MRKGTEEGGIMGEKILILIPLLIEGIPKA